MKRENTTFDSNEIIVKNQVYINEIRRLNDEYTEDKGNKRKYIIKTYGCQMNEHDSEKLDGMLTQMGYEATENKEEANLIIFNTCAVRENAELKVFGNLGALKPLKAKNKDIKIAVCGCMMQQDHVVKEIKQKYRHVDLVFGTHNLHNFPRLLAESFDADSTLIEIWDHEGEIIEGLPVVRKLGIKAFVNIMYGCNNFCTYCIVPYTRGRERSRTKEDVIKEVTDLVNEGVKEVTLLGQNVNSYGKDLDGDFNFPKLLIELNKIEDLKRIRFMTSHPKDLSDELIYAVRDCEKVCEQVHLPVQAGSDALLKAMNRKYTRKDYLDMVTKIRKEIPDVAISTDFIVGFPGETEEDLQDTIDLINEVEYESAYTFIYSIRTGTPAADMEDQIPDDLKHERFNKMLKALNDIVIRKNKSLKDNVLEVLVDGVSKNNDDILTGRTRNFRIVNFPGDKSLIGQLVNVKITEPKNFSLNGVIVE